MGLNCQVPETIPAGQTVVLEGSIRMASPVNDRWVIVEAPHTSSLPGGIMVSNCLLTKKEVAARCGYSIEDPGD